MKNKKNSVYLIVFITLLLLVLFGASYAYFSVNTSNDETLANINASLECIDISYSEDNTISIENQYPITDEYALSHVVPLNVTVTNNCSTNIESINYVLALTSLSNNTGYISDNKMKINIKRTLDGENEETFKTSDYISSLANLEHGNTYNYLNNIISNDETIGSYTNKTIYRIDNNTLENGKENTYKIYVWIDYYEGDTTHTGLNNNSTQGQSYKYNVSLVINSYAKKSTEGIFAGSGTENDPYQINMIEDLVKLSNSVNEGTRYNGDTFSLMRNLDFNSKESYEDANRTDFGDINGNSTIEPLITELTTGSGFQPIGLYEDNKYFGGNFDGKNHRIDNFYTQKETKYLGFFGIITGTMISNLTISGNVTSTYSDSSTGTVGGIIGTVSNTSLPVTISNCHNEINIIGTNSINVGGVIGRAGNDTKINIDNCTNTGTLNGSVISESHNGGIIGFAKHNTSITNSSNNGSVINGNYTGGIVGSAAKDITINNSNNKGTVNTNLGYIGGLIGINSNNLEISSSYNDGVVTCENCTSIGGLAGNNNGNSIINNSYNNKKISCNGCENIGGLSGRNNGDIRINNSYNNANLENGTRIGGLIGYGHGIVIINKCANTGNITSKNNEERALGFGGMIGKVDKNSFIVNSYNAGNITGVSTSETNDYVSGIVGTASSSNYIINSYNTGDIRSSDRAFGIKYSTTSTEYNYMNNVFSTGNIFGDSTASRKVAFLNGEQSDIDNIYCVGNVGDNNCLQSKSIASTTMPLSRFNRQEFVNTLNNNLTSIDLSLINVDETHTLNEYVTLSNWILGPNGYPMLNN